MLGPERQQHWSCTCHWPDTQLMSFLSLTSELPFPYYISWLHCCLTFYDKIMTYWIYFSEIWLWSCLTIIFHWYDGKVKYCLVEENTDLQGHGGLLSRLSNLPNTAPLLCNHIIEQLRPTQLSELTNPYPIKQQHRAVKCTFPLWYWGLLKPQLLYILLLLWFLKTKENPQYFIYQYGGFL